MKALLTIFIIILPFILDACTSDDSMHDNTPTLTLRVELKENEISLFEIFSKVDLVPLKTTDQSLMKGISKVQLIDDMYIILDYTDAKILAFNHHGEFIFKISDKGSGPNEYANISDFEINENSKTICTLAPVDNSIYEYDLSGRFIAKHRLPEIYGAYNKFKIINEDTLAFWTFDYDNRVKIYSKSKNKIIEETFKGTENVLNSFSTTFMHDNYISCHVSNTIYNISKDAELMESHKWNFGTHNNTTNQIKEMEQMSLNDLVQNIPRILNSEIINSLITLQGSTNKYFYTQLWQNGKRINVFYNKDNGKSHVFSKTVEGADFLPLLWHDDYVIGVYNFDFGDIDDIIPDDILDGNNIFIKNSIDEFDNPVLIKYWFK